MNIRKSFIRTIILFGRAFKYGSFEVVLGQTLLKRSVRAIHM
jgi:hypothetical protein